MPTPLTKLVIPQGTTYNIKFEISQESVDDGTIPEDLSYIHSIESEFRDEYNGKLFFGLTSLEGSIVLSNNSITLKIKPSMTTDMREYSGVFDVKVYVNRDTPEEQVSCLIRGTFKLEPQSTQYR